MAHDGTRAQQVLVRLPEVLLGRPRGRLEAHGAPVVHHGSGAEERNEYLFRMANTVRSGVGAITSCGTNAVWNYPLVDEHMPLKHRFNEETMIEDTASSHEAIINHRKGVYHFQRLVLGARKGTSRLRAGKGCEGGQLQRLVSRSVSTRFG